MREGTLQRRPSNRFATIEVTDAATIAAPSTIAAKAAENASAWRAIQRWSETRRGGDLKGAGSGASLMDRPA
jgi:hypothetical protein